MTWNRDFHSAILPTGFLSICDLSAGSLNFPIEFTLFNLLHILDVNNSLSCLRKPIVAESKINRVAASFIDVAGSSFAQTIKKQPQCAFIKWVGWGVISKGFSLSNTWLQFILPVIISSSLFKKLVTAKVLARFVSISGYSLLIFASRLPCVPWCGYWCPAMRLQLLWTEIACDVEGKDTGRSQGRTRFVRLERCQIPKTKSHLALDQSL